MRFVLLRQLIPLVLWILVVSPAYSWQYELSGDFNAADQARAVAVDLSGDIIAVGELLRETSSRLRRNTWTVVKLDGVLGSEIWRYPIGTPLDGQDDIALAVATDSAGDVYSAGRTNGSQGKFAIIKHAGQSGTVLWREELFGTFGSSSVNSAHSLAIHPDSDVVAAGRIRNSHATTRTDFAVVKLSSETGQTVWRTEIDFQAEDDSAYSVAVDANGDIIAAGSVQFSELLSDGRTGLFVVKLSGDTGSQIWSRTIDEGFASGGQLGFAIAIDSIGDAIVSGRLSGSSFNRESFAVLKLSGGDGAEIWRYVVDGSED